MNVYYPIEGDTLPHMFDTFDGGTGASITMSGLAITDIEIYKDGGTTQRASDNGFTLLDTDGIDFDSTTGVHGFSIDLSDNSDSGFYEVGPWYHVVISSITVDSQTVNFVAFAFRIVSATRGLAGTALPNAAADAAGGLPISDAGGLDLDTLLARLDAAISSRMASFTLPTNFADLVITASTGLVSVGTNNDKSGYSITGTLTTLDDLDTAQDTRHTGTQSDIQALDLKVDTIDSNVDAILADTADMQPRFAGITSYPNLFALMMRKDGTYLTELAEINALGGGGGTYSETTDALQAIRDRADTEFNSLATDTENISEAVLNDGVALSTATYNAIRDAILDRVLSGNHDTTGSVGKVIQDTLADTDGLVTSVAALPSQSDITGGAYSLNTDANGSIRIVDGTGVGEIDTLAGHIVQVNQLGTQAKADVNAEVVDVFEVDTHAEIGTAAVPATASYNTMLRFNHKTNRNRIQQSSTVQTIYNDDGTTAGQTRSVSESGGVVTVGEVASA